ncbi:MAG TPA: hypothetical protein PLE81_04130 [Brevundimonas sp.]|jgi:hypothetical protein|nr:hypothetical protein [Brevundimonas sp.]HRH19809.1 hypothetical protein [Brevundimonas sp.]
MNDDLDPEDAAADDRADRQGFNPLLAVGLILLLGVVAYILFVAYA